MSFIGNYGIVFEAPAPEFDGSYWRQEYTSPLMPYSIPVAITPGLPTEQQYTAVTVQPVEPEKPRCDTPEPSTMLLVCAACLAMLWRAAR